MKILMEVPDYSPELGVRTAWDDGFEITVSVEGQCVMLKANAAGLQSLARHFLSLADPSVPNGTHIHMDQYNSLENGSNELIVERQ